jgi:hypothetical protein
MTLALACLVVAGSACAIVQTNEVGPPHANTSPATATDKPQSIDPPVIPSNIFETLKAPADAHAELCANDGQHPAFPDDADLITKSFCQDAKPGGQVPAPTGLADLLKLLGLDFKDPNGQNGAGGNPGFALLAHSSALTARKVTTITPTAFVFTPPPADGSKPKGFVFLAYDPGEQFVEVASHDPTADKVNFYLVLFDKECTHAPGGCTNADLLTSHLVTGWSNVRIYESETALNNTIADCKQCHVPNDKDAPILRMQEIAQPFTHWMSASTSGGKALLTDFHAAHGTAEDYGPIPAGLVDKSDPSKMAQMVTLAGFGKQPNAFASAAIENEVSRSANKQPLVNVPLGKSATWQAAYDAAVGGQFIAAPYHDVKVTDPTKLSAMSNAYKAWLGGTAKDLPDVRDVFLDEGLRDMGFAPKKALNGRQLLVQMCQQCHNQALDQTLSRALFNVDQLDAMTRKEKDVAIDRLRMSLDTRLRMPPALFRTVTADEIELMVEELKK